MEVLALQGHRIESRKGLAIPSHIWRLNPFDASEMHF